MVLIHAEAFKEYQLSPSVDQFWCVACSKEDSNDRRDEVFGDVETG